MSIYAVLTPTTACRALHEAGFPHPAEALHIDAREERWAVSLPDGHIAWFPASEAGATRLAVERRVLGLLATRCSFRVPEILFVSNAGFDVRRMVPGRCDPWGLYRRCQADRRLAQKIGRGIWQILVEKHTRIVAPPGWRRAGAILGVSTAGAGGPPFAQKIGRAIWQILVEQHTRIVEAD